MRCSVDIFWLGVRNFHFHMRIDLLVFFFAFLRLISLRQRSAVHQGLNRSLLRFCCLSLLRMCLLQELFLTRKRKRVDSKMSD